MKNSLLSIFCAIALATPAMADQIVATFIDGSAYDGSIEKFVVAKPSGDITTLAISDVCTIDVTTVDGTVKIETSSSNNSYLSVAKNSTFSIVPAEGVTLTAIDFISPSANYWSTITSETGTVTAVSDTESIWEGNAQSAISYTVGESKKGPNRFYYIVFTYTKSGAGVASIAVENDAPVKYYNLQGMEVVNPQAGSIVISKQGSTVKKVVVK